jgi:TonB-like protein
MRRLLYIGAVACLAGSLAVVLAWRYGETFLPFAVTSATPNPQDGNVAGGVYTNAYFDLSYPLPQGFGEGLVGPAPSDSGYYVLGDFVPQAEPSGSILMAAHDMLFAGPHRDVAAAARDFRESMSQVEAMSIDREPSEVRMGNRTAWRVDFSGVGLYRAMIVTEIRCHLLSVTLTTRSSDEREALVQSLDRLSFAAKRAAPVCIRDYAAGEQVVRKVQPAAEVSSSPTPIPVRIIIGSDGTVKHVHVIRATELLRKNIEDALRQWTFKPHAIAGQAVEVETGLAFGGGRARLSGGQ